MPKKVFIDMDGTLCRFHDTEKQYIERMWEKGFYIGLKPFEEFLQAVSLCIERNPGTQFYILSAVLETEPPFAEDEKREWLHTHLPQLSDDNMIFVPAGSDKSLYFGQIDTDCYLIDDYNKNLFEWRRSGGTAIKFINDINNKGLGAYGGEKGHLWNRESIHYNASAMEICLQIEQYVGISTDTRLYGFEGDVLPEQFMKLIPTYFEERHTIDNTLQAQIRSAGEVLADYASVPQKMYAFSSEYVKSNIQSLGEKFKERFETDDAMLACLEKCYELATVNGVSMTKVMGWLTASINHDMAWKTYPVTSSNLMSYFSHQLARDELLKSLSPQINSLLAEQKHIQRKMYMPSPKEVIRDVIQGGKQQVRLSDRFEKLNESIEALKSEWKELTNADYPNIVFGRQEKPYSQYVTNPTIKEVEK